MSKRHVFKGIIIWSIFLGVLLGTFALLGFGSWFILSPNRGTLIEAVVIPVISIIVTIVCLMLLTGFMAYLLYKVNSHVWNTVHENREGMFRLMPDILGILISYGRIGIEWENRGKEES